MTFNFVRMLRAPKTAALLLLCVCFTAVRTDAQEDVRKSTSIKFVPSDVGFYTASLQLKRQVQGFLDSRAVAKLKSIPIVQLGLAQAKAQWENGGNPQAQAFKQMLQQPENQQLVELLKDAGSNEIFIYGDTSWAEWIGLANRINDINRQAQFESLTTGQSQQELLAKKMSEAIVPMLDTLTFSDLVMGFRLSDPARAQTQLARLEAVGKGVTAQNPALAGRFKREQIAGGNYLTLALDGSLIPWEQIGANVPAEQQPQFEKVVAKLKEKTLTISLGTYQNYLLLSIGDTNEHLKKLGSSSSLATREELAPLAKFGNKSYTGISYASGDFLKHFNSSRQQLDQFVSMAEQLLPQSPVPPDIQKELIADAKKLRDQVANLVPQAGSISSFSWLTDRGFEGFTYSWAGGEALQSNKRLSILEQTGGALGFVAMRTKSSTDEFDMLTNALERGAYYFEKIAVPQMSPDEQGNYRKVKEEMTPLAKRLGTAFRDMLIPALDDGQSAIILDARNTSTKWHEQMPEPPQPLPMLELAIVMGVSDMELLKKGATEIVSVLREATGKLHTMFPDEIPEIKIPEVKSREFPGGVVYYYPIPTEAGLDKQIAPNAGLSKEFLVLSYLPKQTRLLIEKTPPPSDGPLAKGSGPLAAAAYFNFAGLIDAIKPWIEYGMDIASKQDSAASQNIMNFKEPLFTVLDVMKCLRGSSSVTYAEGKAAVTHFEIRIQDL